MEEDWKFFTMRVPVEIHREIKKVCAANQISMKQFAIEALCARLQNQELMFRKLLNEMSPEEANLKLELLELAVSKKKKA